MRAGRRDEKIVIQEPIEAQNKYGEMEVSWIQYSRPWANVSIEKGREWFAEHQTSNSNPIQVTVNYDKNLSDKFRVIFENRIYEIRNLTGFRKRNDSQLICSEIT